MSELKACPFCGGRIIHTPSGESGYICHHCGTERFGEWNTRPIEDALRTRAEKAEEKVKELEDNIISFLYFIKRGKNEKAHLQMLVIESLIDEWKRKRRPIDLPEVER